MTDLFDLISDYLYGDICDGRSSYNMGELARTVCDTESGYDDLDRFVITMQTDSRTLFAGSMIDPPEYEYRVSLDVIEALPDGSDRDLGSFCDWGEDGCGRAIDDALDAVIKAANWMGG